MLPAAVLHVHRLWCKFIQGIANMAMGRKTAKGQIRTIEASVPTNQVLYSKTGSDQQNGKMGGRSWTYPSNIKEDEEWVSPTS